MIMTVSERDDWRVQEAKMARAHAHHERTSLVGRWCNEGRITVMEDNDPVNIRLRIEDEFFAEPRDKFPSVELIAKLQLAIHAGRSDHKTMDAYEAIAHRISTNTWLHKFVDMGRRYGGAAAALEAGYANVAKITAAVKRRQT